MPPSKTQQETFWTFFIAAIGLPSLVGLIWASQHGFDHVAVDIAMIALFMILLVDIPLCVMILIGHPVTMTLSPLISSRAEREKWREMRQRRLLSDDEFIERYYSGVSIPRDIPLRLRRIHAEQLGMEKVQPGDLATEFDWELDLWDLAVEVQDEFGVAFTMEEVRKPDGSFDSVVRAVAAKL